MRCSTFQADTFTVAALTSRIHPSLVDDTKRFVRRGRGLLSLDFQDAQYFPFYGQAETLTGNLCDSIQAL